MLSSAATLLNELGPAWTPLGAFVWLLYQLYWPYHETKIQNYHHQLSRRLERIEITQVALAEEVGGVSAKEVKAIHDKDSLSTSDLKEN